MPARCGRSVPLHQQAFALRSTFPDSTVDIQRNTLTWVGQLRPTELSGPYTVQIIYTVGQYPQVRALDPPIMEHYEFVPHCYNDGQLCVHDANDWFPSLLLIDSIVAWTAEWLLFWELFLATGRWFGDGPDNDYADVAPTDELPSPPQPQ